MNDVSETGEKHTYRPVTIYAHMVSYWAHLQPSNSVPGMQSCYKAYKANDI